jgi:hypothetical protein
MPSKLVLLAIPEEWNNLSEGGLFIDYLRNEGFDVMDASSYEAALGIIQSQDLFAVVMTSDWAIRQDNGSPGLMEFLRDKVPTYSLITQTTGHKVGYDWLDELYKGQKHEYQNMPAAIDAIIVWLNQIIDNES